MFYLFHGKDDHSQRETLAKLLAKEGDADMLSLNTTRLSNKITFAELQSACDAMPFLSRVRIVLVEDLLSTVPDKTFMNQLEAYLPHLPATTRLVFLESQPLADTHRIIRLVDKEKVGYVKRFDPPEGGALERWIREHVAERGGQITPQAVRLLADNVAGGQGEHDRKSAPFPVLPILTNEIEKLVLYKGEGGLIEAADVELLSPYVADVSIFDLVDALGNRQAARAAELFQKKLDEGVDPFLLFAMFVRQFRLLLQTRYLLDAGERPPDIAEQLKQKAFVVGKLTQQARNYTLPQLEQIYGRLLEIDVDAKTGKADLLTSLYLLVAGLTPVE